MSHRGRPRQESDIILNTRPPKRAASSVVFDLLYPIVLAVFMIIAAHWYGIIDDSQLRSWMPEFVWKYLI